MRDLGQSLREHRRRGADLKPARWRGVAGRMLHRVQLPSGQVVIARGGDETYTPGQKVTLGVHSGGSLSSHTLIGHPPLAQQGGSVLPDLEDGAAVPVVQIVAAVPEEVAIGQTTPVYVIGWGFAQAPLTRLAAYDRETSDPVAGVWVDDPLVTLGLPAWIDPGAPPPEVAEVILPGQTVLLVDVTLDASAPVGHPVSLRVL